MNGSLYSTRRLGSALSLVALLVASSCGGDDDGDDACAACSKAQTSACQEICAEHCSACSGVDPSQVESVECPGTHPIFFTKDGASHSCKK
ncbi:MAG: hypothetical protein IPM35_25245 [Myxococcales bacterium]|nr:hypothetical protein [Myxococcales bacterium]